MTLLESRISIYATQIKPGLHDMQAVTSKGLERIVKGYAIISEHAYAISSGTLTKLTWSVSRCNRYWHHSRDSDRPNHWPPDQRHDGRHEQTRCR